MLLHLDRAAASRRAGYTDASAAAICSYTSVRRTFGVLQGSCIESKLVSSMDGSLDSEVQILKCFNALCIWEDSLLVGWQRWLRSTGRHHWLRRTHTRGKATASDWRIFGLLQRPSFDRKTVSRPVVIAGSEVQNSTHHWPYMYTRPPPNGAAQNRTRLAA